MALVTSGIRASLHLVRGELGSRSSRSWRASKRGRTPVSGAPLPSAPAWSLNLASALEQLQGLLCPALLPACVLPVAGEAVRGFPPPPPHPPQALPLGPALSGAGAQAPCGPTMGGDVGRRGFILSSSFWKTISSPVLNGPAGQSPPSIPGHGHTQEQRGVACPVRAARQ